MATSPPETPARWAEYEVARRRSRRRFLAAGLLGIVGLVAGTAVIATPFLRQGPYVPRPDGIDVLDDMRYAVLRAVALALLPGGVDPAPALARLDRTLGSLDLTLRRSLLAMPALIEGSGVLFGGQLCPFSELPTAERQHVLDRWAGSHLLVCRQAVAEMRQLILMHHYGAGRP